MWWSAIVRPYFPNQYINQPWVYFTELYGPDREGDSRAYFSALNQAQLRSAKNSGLSAFLYIDSM